MPHALITLRLVCASSSWRWGHSSGPCRAVCCDCAQVQSISAILNMDRDHRHRGDGSGQGNWCRVNRGIFLPFRRLVIFFFLFCLCFGFSSRSFENDVYTPRKGHHSIPHTEFPAVLSTNEPSWTLSSFLKILWAWCTRWNTFERMLIRNSRGKPVTVILITMLPL